ncbi:MAG TPA: ATP-binding protein [Opitutaceae bacterium]|nr:ATP-binding protein [Opitutaceae bacterium]
MAFDQQHKLWVGATNEIGFFDLKDGAISTYHSLISELPQDIGALGDVWYVFTQDNVVTFITHDRIIRWVDGHIKIWEMPGESKLPAFLLDGKIYVHHHKTGLWVIEPDGPKLYLPPEIAGPVSIIWAKNAQNGRVFLTNNGFFKLKENKLVSLSELTAEFIKTNILSSVCELPNGDVCIGTLKGGLAIVSLNGELKTILDSNSGLPTRSIFSLFCDRDGAIWITSSNSIFRIKLDDIVSLFDATQGLSGKPMRTITEHANQLVIATDEGVFEIPLAHGAKEHFSLFKGLAGNYQEIRDIENGLWAAGYQGIELFNEPNVRRIYITTGQVFTFQRSSVSPETYYLADLFSVVRLVFPATTPVAPATISTLPDQPTALAEDIRGDLWASTYARGVFRIKNPRTAPTVACELASSGPSSVARVNKFILSFTGNGPVFTAGGSAKFSPIPVLPQSLPAAISNVGVKGEVWLAFESPFKDGVRGFYIGKLEIDDQGTTKWESYAIEGSIATNGIRTLFLDSRNILWIGGNEALLRVDVSKLKAAHRPVAPRITSSCVYGEKLDYQGNLIRLEFSALEYGDREGIRFQSMLDGNDRDWSAPTNANSVTLNSLREGEYEFRVRTITDTGLVSTPATWKFTVLPPWYRTSAALVVFGLLTLSGALGAVQLRSRYLKKQNLRLEELVQKKTAQLEKANAAKTEFVANMSHEIRNPISGILGLALALEETPLSDEQRKINESVRNCAALLATLVDDVLDFAKIEAGEIELKPAVFGLRTIVDQCVTMLREEARKVGSKITVELDSALPDQFVGDSARIQQILINYLGNALKFGAGQQIVVGGAMDPNGQIRLYVRDHGPGIAEDDATNLFTKFTRLKSARDGNIRGTGLGLALCRALAKKMGGSVGVESKLGSGSQFWLSLPLAPATTAIPVESFTHATKALLALIVEDLEYNALAMRAVLRKVGLQSEVAVDGNMAVEMLTSGRFDVAFMDWDLPGKNGAEITKTYRAIESRKRHTVIIATTAHSTPAIRDACLRAGMDAFISKPLTPEKIARALRELEGGMVSTPSVETPVESTERKHGLDLQLLHFLADDSKDGLSIQIDRFLTSFEEIRTQARQEIEVSRDPATLYRAGHRLLSHAKMISAGQLEYFALRFQEEATAGHFDKLPATLDKFDEQFAEVRKALESIRVSPAPV